MKHQLVIVVDFGGQYNQLIARRVRDLNVYCEVVPYKKALDVIKEKQPIGIIFTGGPNSVYEENSPQIDKDIFELNIPILGMCYGMQLISKDFGGVVEKAKNREFGKTNAKIANQSSILKDMSDESIVWMSHTDFVSEKPEGFDIIQTTDSCPVAAIANEDKKIYAVQYQLKVKYLSKTSFMKSVKLMEIGQWKTSWKNKSKKSEKLLTTKKFCWHYQVG